MEITRQNNSRRADCETQAFVLMMDPSVDAGGLEVGVDAPPDGSTVLTLRFFFSTLDCWELPY